MSFFSYVPGGTSYGSHFPSKKERDAIDRQNKRDDEYQRKVESGEVPSKCGRD